jgi:hypothetical protein
MLRMARHNNIKKQTATSQSARLLAIQNVLGDGTAANPGNPS